MDLTKRLGFSDDILKAATEVLEGKKISHPNQKKISAAAPPEDEITPADFKALKAKKKKHRVEGFDRNNKRYESPLFETYEEALSFYTKLRKSAPLTNLEIVQIDELSQETLGRYMEIVAGKPPGKQRPSHYTGIVRASQKLYNPGKIKVPATPEKVKVTATEEAVDEAVSERPLRGRMTEPELAVYYNKLPKEKVKPSTASDILKSIKSESKELDTANANAARAHDCAKHVVHEQWGVGETVPTMHAEPDAEGNIAWYDVMFEHGIEHQVLTAALEITLSETHVHKNSKRMTAEQKQHGTKEKMRKGKPPQVVFNPDPQMKKEEVEVVGEKEETESLDEGRKAGVVGSVLSNPAAREHFKKLTGKEPSYFHISKNPEHAQAALNHAAKAKAPEGEKPAEAGDGDTEANKHPINQLRGVVDRGGGKFMGKDITKAHASKLISMHDDLKPAQKLDFVSNIGKHLSKVMS